MSAVKLKNAVVRAINAAIATGEIPDGVLIGTQLRDNRIWVEIDDAPFNTYLPGICTVERGFISVKIHVGGGDEEHYTAEGIALKAKVLEVAHRACAQGVIVHLSMDCGRAQARRAAAVPVAVAVAEPAPIAAGMLI